MDTHCAHFNEIVIAYDYRSIMLLAATGADNNLLFDDVVVSDEYWPTFSNYLGTWMDNCPRSNSYFPNNDALLAYDASRIEGHTEKSESVNDTV